MCNVYKIYFQKGLQKSNSLNVTHEEYIAFDLLSRRTPEISRLRTEKIELWIHFQK